MEYKVLQRIKFNSGLNTPLCFSALSKSGNEESVGGPAGAAVAALRSVSQRAVTRLSCSFTQGVFSARRTRWAAPTCRRPSGVNGRSTTPTGVGRLFDFLTCKQDTKGETRLVEARELHPTGVKLRGWWWRRQRPQLIASKGGKKEKKGTQREIKKGSPCADDCLSVWSYKFINGGRWEESRRGRGQRGGGRVLIEGEDGATCVCMNK